MRKYDLTETAKLVRNALKAMWPKTKFSVTSKRYAGGCSIDVSWTDGPIWKEVNKVLDRFERCGFDGMTDCKTYNPNSEFNGEACEFGADYVQGQRTESDYNIKAAALRTAFECDLPLLKLGTFGLEGGENKVPWVYCPDQNCFAHDPKGGEWYSQLVYQVARSTSHEAIATIPAAMPVIVSSQLIDSVVERMDGQQGNKQTKQRGQPTPLRLTGR